MNRVILIGRVSSKPTFVTTKSNIPFIRFSLAVSRRKYSQDAVPITDFLPIVGWRQNAISLDKLITLGSLVAIEGSLHSHRAANSMNPNAINYEVQVENFHILETKEQLEMRRQKLAQRSQRPTFGASFNSFESSENSLNSFEEMGFTASQNNDNDNLDSLENPLADWDIDGLDPEKME